MLSPGARDAVGREDALHLLGELGDVQGRLDDPTAAAGVGRPRLRGRVIQGNGTLRTGYEGLRIRSKAPVRSPSESPTYVSANGVTESLFRSDLSEHAG